MPPANDEIPNATVVTDTTTFSVTTVDSTGEAQELSEGYDDTGVWYRVEIQDGGDITLAVANANYPYYIEVYLPTDSTPSNFSDVTDGFTYNSFVDAVEDNGNTGDVSIQVPTLAGEVYYLRVGDYDFDGSEGTLTLLIGLPCTLDAAPGANLASGTVSIIDTDWVLDEQARTLTAGSSYKGDWDYTTSFEVEITCPAGRYQLEMLARTHDSGGLGDGQDLRILKNGRHYGGYYDSLFGPSFGDDTPTWLLLSQPSYIDRSFTPDAKNFGGPLFFDLAPGDVLTFCFGGVRYTADQVQTMSVQKIRLTPILATDTKPPQWRIGGDEGESAQDTWGNFDLLTIDMVKAFGNIIYVLSEWDLSGPTDQRALNIMTFEVVGDRIEPLSGDQGLTQVGGDMEDLVDSFVVPGIDPNDYDIWGKDFTVMPNGDIYLVFGFENDVAVSTRQLVMCHYDESGGSWSLIEDEIRPNDPDGRFITSVSVDNDGTDVYFAFGESRQATSAVGFGYWWQSYRYNVGGGTFTQLGSGQTAFPGAAATKTVDGEFDRGVRLKCSPAGVPWVAFSSYDPDHVGVGEYEEHAFAWFWNGSAWVDSEVPDPSILPSTHSPPNHVYTLGGGHLAHSGSENYVKFAVYGFYQVDLTFCHHDGPNEDPAICFQYVFNDTGTSIHWDGSGFSYFEYGGTPGDWANEVRIVEGDAAGGGNLHGRDEPFENWFRQAEDNLNGDTSRAHGWTQGFSLENDGSVPILMSQKGFRFSVVDRIYAAKLLSDGTLFVPIGQGFADYESVPEFDDAGWTDVTTNAGTMVGTRPVLCWRSTLSWTGGLNLALFLPAGGVVSMNWRSADRRADANRVLVGDR